MAFENDDDFDPYADPYGADAPDDDDEPEAAVDSDAARAAAKAAIETGDPAPLTPPEHLSVQLFLLENPGDSHRASEALQMDTRAALSAMTDNTPGDLVTEYYADTKNPTKFTHADGTTSARDPRDLAAALIIDRDKGAWEGMLKAAAAEAGATYDPSDLAGVIRNFSYAANAGRDPQEMIDHQAGLYQARGASGGDRETGGYDTGWDDTDPRRLAAGAPPPPGYTGVNWQPTLGGGPLGGGGIPWSPASGGVPAGGSPYQGAMSPTTGGGTGPQSLMGPWTGTVPTAPTIAPYPAWTPYEAPAPYEAPTPYVPGTYDAPTYTPAQPFVPPTAAQAAADPGYQFALQQGQEALERSGAARGVTNTGGTLRNILDYGQQAAQQQYGDVYNRMAGTYGMNEAARQAAFGLNAPTQFQGWAANEAGRLGAYQMTEADRAAAYAQNEANRRAAAQFNVVGGQQAWQGEAGRQQQDYANRYRQWTDQYNQWRQQGQDRFNEQWMLANA